MRYTGEAAMEERTLRDVERWKDKIEVRLDNRQVFFLFFGSALVACLLFILGVVVGKRLESRGRVVAPEIEDPLALLDRVAATPAGADESLSFARALTAGKPAARKVPRADAPKAVVVAMGSKPDQGKSESAKSEAPKLEPKSDLKDPPKADATKVESAKAEATKAESTKADLTTAQHPAATTPAAAKSVVVKPQVQNTVPATAVGSAPKFALQLGSFQTQEEADAFAALVQDQSPYVVVSNIPGKGVWYRVRVGTFDTAEQAVAAKADFERHHKMIAYVAPK